MSARRRALRLPVAAAALYLAASAVSAQTVDPRAAAPVKDQPVRFEQNRGQADARVRYVSRARDYTVALTEDEALLLVRKPATSSSRGRLQASDMALLRMRLSGGSPAARITAHDSVPGTVYLADTTTQGPLTPIDTFARVEYSGVYPGIDLVYYGSENQLEFDFVVAPFADPSQIALSLDGAEGITLTDAGDLSMRVGGAEVRLEKPLLYQERDGSRIEIPGAYALPTDDTSTVRFRVGSYDRSLPLVIDPSWMTVFGSLGEDYLSGFAVDSAGRPRVLGTTFDPGSFPFTHQEDGELPPPNCFLAKHDANTGLNIYTILFRNTQNCGTLALAPNDRAYFTGFVFPNEFRNDQGTTVTVVDDSGAVPVVNRFGVTNYDSSAVGEGVDALAVNSLGHVFLLGPCRLGGTDDPKLMLSGYNELPDPAQLFYSEGCTVPTAGTSEKYQPVLTVVDSTGVFLYGSFLSPGEEVTRYGLAADAADRAYIVGGQVEPFTVLPTADAYRAACPTGGSVSEICAYLMVLDTTTTGSESLTYASYLWNTQNVETVAVRLAPTGEVYIASEGRVFDDFPSNRPTNPISWPYSLYPALRDGIQLARFNRDASGRPSQFEFATVFDPHRAVAALEGQTVRDELAGLALFPSGAPVVASIAHSQLAPLGITTAFDPSGDRLGEVWTQNLGTRTPVAFGAATGSAGSLYLAGQIDDIGAQNTDIFVERIDSVDPGMNRPPTADAGPDQTVTVGSRVHLYAGNSLDPDGDPLTYEWAEGTTVLGTDVFIALVPTEGDHVITLTVDDGRGGVDTDTITVHVVPNTPAGGSQTVTPPDQTRSPFYLEAPVTIHFENVTATGSTMLTSRYMVSPVPPPGMQFGSPPLHYDLTTTAGFTGDLNVCFDYRGQSFARPDTDVRLYQQVNGTWALLPQNNDTGARRVCGTTATLGTFALFTPAVPANEISLLAGQPVLTPFCARSPGPDPNDGGFAVDSTLCNTRGLAYDAARNYVYFAESWNTDAIRRIDLTTGRITTVAGTGFTTGALDGTGGDTRDDDKNNVDPLTAPLNQVLRVALDAQGNLILAEYGAGRLRKVDFAQNRIYTIADVIGFTQPSALAIDSSGAAFFSSFAFGDPVIWRLTPGADGVLNGSPDEVLRVVAGNGTRNFDPNQIPPDGIDPLQFPVETYDLAFGPDGSLYAAGQNGGSVLRITPGPDGFVDGVADTMFRVAGGGLTTQPHYGDGGAATNAYFQNPISIAVAANGDVYVGDTGTSFGAKARKISAVDGVVTGASDEIITTVGGFYIYDEAFFNGNPLPFSNGDGHALSSIFGANFDLLVMPNGNVLVNDYWQVRRIGTYIAAPALTIDTLTISDAVEGGPYVATIQAAGGTGTGYTWSISAGALPEGLALAEPGTPSTTISGTPTEDGTFNFTVHVTDSGGNTGTRDYTLVVQSPPTIDTLTVPSATVGDPYSATIAAAGGTGTGYAWTVSDGALPNGLTLAQAGTPSTTITGTPTEHGTFNFTVRVTDSGGASATRAFALVVNASVVEINVAETIRVTDAITVLPSAMVGLTEQITVTDTPAVLPSARVDITERITVTDSVAVLPSAMVAVVEQIVIHDAPDVEPEGDTTPPIAVLDVPPLILAGQSLSLSGARSSDVGGAVARYRWQIPDAGVDAETIASSYEVTWDVLSALSPGQHTASLIVFDSSGNASALVSASFSILTSQSITPANGAPPLEPVLPINTSPGEQLDPHVSEDLIAYTDNGIANPTIRFFDFSTGVDAVVPTAPGNQDYLSDVNEGRITFTRQSPTGQRAVLMFVPATGTTAVVSPFGGGGFFATAIGHSTVAFMDEMTNGDIQLLTVNLSTGLRETLLTPARFDINPNVSPDGNTVVWQSCIQNFTNCDVFKAVGAPGAWVVSPVTAMTSNEADPDTDGTSIVYSSDRAGSTGGTDVYYQPIAGGVETRLNISGIQRNPSISSGVIAFESTNPADTSADLYVYVIATNLLYRVTSTPSFNETLSDISVLDNGHVRVVWVANDGELNQGNVYAKTFSLLPRPTLTVSPASGAAGGPITLSAVLTFDGSAVENAAIRFSIEGADAGAAVTDASGTATLTATLPALAPSTYPEGIRALFTGNETLGFAVATAALTVDASADLSIVASAFPTTVDAGGTVRYNVTVTNNGPSPASDVSINASGPASLIFGATNSPGGPCLRTPFGGSVDCHVIAPIPAGGVYSLTIDARPTTAGTVSASFTVTSSPDDPSSANNQAVVAVSVNPVTDLAVAVVPSRTLIAVGESLTYAVSVTNNGPATATGAFFTVLPANGFVIDGTTLPGGACSVATFSGLWSCALGTIGSGATVQFSVFGRVMGSSPGTNSFAVGSALPDPNPANNVVGVTFNARPTVTINQAAGQSDPTTASPINFTVVFSESVAGFSNTDISFAGSSIGGTLAATVTGSGASYNVAVSGMTGVGTVTVSIPANAALDSGGMPSAASTSTDSSVLFGVATVVAMVSPSNGGNAALTVLKFGNSLNGILFYARGTTVLTATRFTSLIIDGQTATVEGFSTSNRFFTVKARDGGSGQPDTFRLWIDGVEQTAASGALSTGTVLVQPWAPDTRLKGWVDLHTHPMSNIAFGGKLFHGAPSVGSLMPAVQMPNDPQCRFDQRATSIAEALSQDGPTRGDPLQSRCGDVIRNTLIKAVEQANGAIVAPAGADGYPAFTHWPKWNDITHQKMWVDWIRRSWEGGQRVMVALSHNNRTLADLLGAGGPITGVRTDRASSDLQIDEIKRLVADHPDFMGLATTPDELRAIVQDGRLAVVLGIEIDKIGDFSTTAPPTLAAIDAEIARLHANGVRYILPVHFVDNPLGDTAIDEPLFNILNFRENGSFFTLGCAQFTDEIGFQFSGLPAILTPFLLPGMPVPPVPPCAFGHVNARSPNGLTTRGDFAIRAMMRRGIIVDIDHMSNRAANRTLAIANAVPDGGYPVTSGHSGIRERSSSQFNSEIMRSTTQLARIACLGGMFGLGTDTAGGHRWAQQYERGYNVMRRAFAPNGVCPNVLPLGAGFIGLGTDANSLVKSPVPPLLDPVGPVRFADIYNAGNPLNSGVPALARSTTGTKTWDYNVDGVAHYGMFVDFLRDVRMFNLPGSMPGREMVDDQMMYGADYFYRMWLKAETQKTRVP